MEIKIMIETSLFLPEGFYAFICNTCNSHVIMTEKYFPINSNKCAYSYKDLVFCPLCAGKITTKTEA